MKLNPSGPSTAHSSTVLHPPYTDPRSVSPDAFPVDATPGEKLWFALNWAVLAPSNHNSQPWRFHIHETEVDLYSDRSRALPIVDPDNRELLISCGAALLHLRIALDYFGYRPQVEMFPDHRRPNLLARVQISTHTETSADAIVLFDAMADRRTNRHLFRDEPVAESVILELQTAAQDEGAWLQIVERPDSRTLLAELIAEADQRQWADRHFRQELAAWIRPGQDNRHDGLSVASQDLGAILSHAGPLAIRTFDLGKGHAAKDREIALYSPVLAVLGTEVDDPAGWMSAGQALGRVLLEAQSEGVSASFLNAPVEIPDLRTRLTEELGRGGFPQQVIRLGYGSAVPPTRRRSVREVLQVYADPPTAS